MEHSEIGPGNRDGEASERQVTEPHEERGGGAEAGAEAGAEGVAKHSAEPLHAWYPPVKMAGEWATALVLLVLVSPLIVLCVMLVKVTSDGPGFYSQVRLGRFGKPFRMYKIRTMRHNCEAATGAVWSTPNDMRVTRVGRLLRDTHLDELPQLWNVLMGEMSLIGPRPERPELVPRIERAVPNYRQRLAVRPGVTGLAQMQLPPDTDLEGVSRKLAYDLYYVRHVGPGMDVRIGLCTALYFLGAAVQSTGKLLVKGDGIAVECGLPEGLRSMEQAPVKPA